MAIPVQTRAEVESLRMRAVVAIVRSLLALLTSIFLLLVGNSLQFVVLGLRAEAESFPTLVIGLLTAGYYMGYAIGTLGATWTVKTIGHVRARVQ